FGFQNSTTAILPCLRAPSTRACLAGTREGPAGARPEALAPARELARAGITPRLVDASELPGASTIRAPVVVIEIADAGPVAEARDASADLRSRARADHRESATAPWALSIARDRPATPGTEPL